MIYQEVSKSDFFQAFHDMGRKDQFSADAKSKLFDWLEEYSDHIAPMELDVIALCVEWSEMDLTELQDQYSEYLNEDDDPNDLDTWLDVLECETVAMKTDADTVLLMDF